MKLEVWVLPSHLWLWAAVACAHVAHPHQRLRCWEMLCVWSLVGDLRIWERGPTCLALGHVAGETPDQHLPQPREGWCPAFLIMCLEPGWTSPRGSLPVLLGAPSPSQLSRDPPTPTLFPCHLLSSGMGLFPSGPPHISIHS